jgi:hypothetical protein
LDSKYCLYSLHWWMNPEKFTALSVWYMKYCCSIMVHVTLCAQGGYRFVTVRTNCIDTRLESIRIDTIFTWPPRLANMKSFHSWFCNYMRPLTLSLLHTMPQVPNKLLESEFVLTVGPTGTKPIIQTCRNCNTYSIVRPKTTLGPLTTSMIATDLRQSNRYLTAIRIPPKSGSERL